MTAIDQKIISKIRKTLNLARDNYGNDEESQSIMLKAQELMAKHNISMADIDMGVDDSPNYKKTEEQSTEYMKMQWWMKNLSMIIAENFKCYVYISSWNRKSKLVFLGLEEDVQVAKEVYEFAVESINYHVAKYVKNHVMTGDRAKTIGIKNDYIAGYMQGLKDKFKEQIEREGWGLMIYTKDPLVVKAYNELSLRSTSASKRSSSNDSKARTAGYKDGKNFEK